MPGARHVLWLDAREPIVGEMTAALTEPTHLSADLAATLSLNAFHPDSRQRQSRCEVGRIRTHHPPDQVM
jgi:hypothetical protein